MSNIQQFDYSVNLSPAIIWQYNAATVLQSIIAQKQTFYTLNQQSFWEYFQTHIFGVLNIPPAQLTSQDAFGLLLWSIILGQPLQIGNTVDYPSNKPIFGFNWQNSSWVQNLNYFRANYTNGGTFPILTLDQEQLLLRLRYFDLTTRGDVLDINRALNDYFPGVNGFTGSVYVLDGLNMTIFYIFTGGLSGTLNYILRTFDILPRPAGVNVIIYSNIYKVFGFGPYNQNFGNGCFIGV